MEKPFNRFCYVLANLNQLNKKNHNSILIIIDWLTKIVHYKPVRVTIDTSGLAKVIINVIVRYHSPLDLIVIN